MVPSDLDPAPLGYAHHHGHSLTSRALGLAGFITFAGWGALTQVDLAAFVDLPSLLMGAVAPVCLLVAAVGFQACITTVRVVALGGGTAPQQRRAVATCRLAAACGLGCGLMGMLVGLIQMLTQLAQPSALGAGIAVALLSPLYGTLIAVVSMVGAGLACERGDVEGGGVERVARHVIPVAGAFGMVTVFVVLAVGAVVHIQLS